MPSERARMDFPLSVDEAEAVYEVLKTWLRNQPDHESYHYDRIEAVHKRLKDGWAK